MSLFPKKVEYPFKETPKECTVVLILALMPYIYIRHVLRCVRGLPHDQPTILDLR